jgi:hypothetical protein
MNLKTIRFQPLGSPTHPFFLPLNEQLFNAVVPPAWRCMLLTAEIFLECSACLLPVSRGHREQLEPSSCSEATSALLILE